MSTKPTIANARWADVAGTPSAGTSAPSSGKRDTGWAVEKPTYQNMNYLLRQFYLWCQYVSDQVFTGLFTADTLASVGDIQHGSFERTIHPSNWFWQDTDNAGAQVAVYLGATAGGAVGAHVDVKGATPIDMPLDCLRTNDRVTQVDVSILAPAGDQFTLKLLAEDRTAGTLTTVATGTSNTGTFTRQTISLSGLNHQVGSDAAYFLRLSLAGVPGGVCSAFSARVTYNHTP